MWTPETPDYRTFDIHGSHADLGYELGSQDPPFRMQPWWAHAAPLHFTRECAAAVHDAHPPLIDEQAAYAHAQKLAFDDLWRLCCRVDLKARFRVRAADAEGCSSFAWRLGGRMLVGRNYDYWPLQARRQRIRFNPAGAGWASLGARGGVPCGRYDGLNAHGVFFALHVVMTDSPQPGEIRPGIPFHLIGRIVLETCDTARAAADLLLRLPHLSALNYLVADARDAFVIEADPRGTRLREGPRADRVAATNHFTHPDMTPWMGRRSVHNSACRLDFLVTRAAQAADEADVDALLAMAGRIMADRSAPMCGSSGALTTLWSCVAELGSRRIRYAAGAPDATPYEELT